MRVLICGDRNYRNAKSMFHYLSTVPKDTIIIEGEAKGADTIAWVCCEILGLKYISFPANWAAYHKAAGVKRNQEMLDQGKPDLVVFYHDNLDESRGTIDMITRADRAGIIVEAGPEYDNNWRLWPHWAHKEKDSTNLNLSTRRIFGKGRFA